MMIWLGIPENALLTVWPLWHPPTSGGMIKGLVWQVVVLHHQGPPPSQPVTDNNTQRQQQVNYRESDGAE